MSAISADTKGVFVIAATPFRPDGEIDAASIDSMVDFYFDKGADGLTILGVMGEAPKLTHSEALEITRRTLKRAGSKPIIVGVSAPGLAALGELTKAVMDLGAAGVMAAPPATLRTDDQIVGYYASVVETIGKDVPLCLQDFPLVTGVTITHGTLGRIFEANPSVVMLKHEDWPGLDKISAPRAAEEAGRRRVSILCDNGGLFLPEEMRRGADGRYEQQPGLGLAVRKYVLAKRGAISSAAQRRPGAALSPAAVAEVEFLVARQERRLRDLG